jgi:hypothetical protein
VADKAQDRQAPEHAEPQHTPCAQNVDWHSVPSRQAWPSPLRPHDPFVHTAGATQSASMTQALLQIPAPQRYGAHEVGAGVAHEPAPSHVAVGVNIVEESGHAASLQDVPFTYF